MGKLGCFFDFLVCRSSNSRKKAPRSTNPSTNESTLSRPESIAVLQVLDQPPSNASLRSITVEPNPTTILQNFKSPRNNTCLCINTVKQKENIEVADFKPEQKTMKKRLKYTCPICFRYFSEMLKTDCCGNYICLYCAQDLNECIKTQKIEKVLCHFCKKENFTVSDVQPEDKLRRYSDSPYSSASNTMTGSFGNNNRLKFLDAAAYKPNKQYSSTFSGFGEVRADNLTNEESDEKYEAIKSASCGFHEPRKVAHESKHSQYSERMDENLHDEELDGERGPRKLFPAFGASNVLNRPHSYSFELGSRYEHHENENVPPNRNVSVIFEKENDDITLSEIPTTRARPNNRQRSPTRLTSSITGIGRSDDRSALPRSHISERILSIQSGLRG